MEVTKANLATYLAGLIPSATPYPIEIIETVASDWGDSATIGTVGSIIRASTPSGVYLDLGLTIIPLSVINMSSTFDNCTAITTAPIIPLSVTNMGYTFYGCTSLTTAPIIPSSVTNMGYTFYGCTSLTTAPIIPSSVTNMTYAFFGCTAITTAPIIPSSVTNMVYTFFGCTSLHMIQNFAVDVDNCDMTTAFSNCPALANIYVTTLTESTWHLLHTDTDATGTNYTIYNPDGTVAGSGTVAGTSQVLTLYGKSDELVISANITPTLAVETATSQVQWHKSGLPYDDELMIFNAKNPDTVISNFITVNRAGEEFLGNASTATTATQANAIKPLGNSIKLTATSTSVTKIIKIATINYDYSGTFNIRCSGVYIADVVKVDIEGHNSTVSGVRVVYGKNNATYGIKKIVVTYDTPIWNSNRQIYAEIVTYANNPSTTTLGVVETNYGTFTPSMTEVSSVEGTVVDSLELSYRRGDISSYQHVFTKDIIGNVTGNVTGKASESYPIPTDAVLQYSFDEIGDVIIDNSYSEAHATNYGVIPVDGVCGKAGYFNNSYMMAPRPALGDDITIYFWAKFDALGSHTILQSRTVGGQGLTIYLSALDLYRFEWRGNQEYFTGYTPPVNTWHHVCMKMNATTKVLKINGETKVTLTGTFGTTANLAPTIWSGMSGTGGTPSGAPLTGALDGLKIVPRFTTDDEDTGEYKARANLPKFYTYERYLIENL